MKLSYYSPDVFRLSKIIKGVTLNVTSSSTEPFPIAQMRWDICVGNGKRKMNPPEHQKEFDSAKVGRKFQVKFADA